MVDDAQNVSPYQEAFLLDVFARADGGKLTRAKAKLPAAVAKPLKLDAAGTAGLLERWVRDGLVVEVRKGKSVSYQLTDAGSGRLRELDAFRTLPPPPLPEPAHDDPVLLGYQKAFLLLTLYQSPGRRAQGAVLKRKAKVKKVQSLRFDDLALAWVSALLVGDKLVIEHRKPRAKNADYELADEGVRFLASADQQEDLVLTLSGREFNELRAAGKSSTAVPAIIHSRPAEITGEAPVSLSAELPAASDDDVLSECRHLLGEQFGHSGLVPIHALRSRLAEKFGPAAARHELLDAQLRRLRREERLRLVAISDRSDATEQQLADSIPGENELFFYVGNLQ